MEEALAECRAALHGATATMLHAHAPNTVKRRQQHAAKAEAFFASLPKELGVSLKTAGPEHVLWFVRQHWLPRHTGKPCMGRHVASLLHTSYLHRALPAGREASVVAA